MAKTVDRLNKQKLRNTLIAMASLFEAGKIKKMSDITTMYPTGIVAALGINYGGFMTKCASPEKFSFEDVIKLAHILEIDINLILQVVVKEAIANTPKKDLKEIVGE